MPNMYVFPIFPQCTPNVQFVHDNVTCHFHVGTNQRAVWFDAA